VDGTSGGGAIDFDPFLTAEAEDTPCSTQPSCADLFPCGKKGDKVEVCHIPFGKPRKAHTICIDPSALDSHLENHGDYCGPCIDECEDMSHSKGKSHKNEFNLFCPKGHDSHKGPKGHDYHKYNK
jgi:hypothetical protein